MSWTCRFVASYAREVLQYRFNIMQNKVFSTTVLGPRWVVSARIFTRTLGMWATRSIALEMVWELGVSSVKLCEEPLCVDDILRGFPGSIQV